MFDKLSDMLNESFLPPYLELVTTTVGQIDEVKKLILNDPNAAIAKLDEIVKVSLNKDFEK